MRKSITIIALILVVLAGVGLYVKDFSPSHSSETITPSVKQITTLTYKGENGKDALTLLKQHATIKQNHSGLVISIDGTQPTGHNYWAFYINGKYASVGPASYKTKNSDTLFWKIEKY
jgi:uncharacterized protein DUF4430